MAIATVPAGASMSMKLNAGVGAGGKTLTKTQSWGTNIKAGVSTIYNEQAYNVMAGAAPLLEYPPIAVYAQDKVALEIE